jgi:hypothetical protein
MKILYVRNCFGRKGSFEARLVCEHCGSEQITVEGSMGWLYFSKEIYAHHCLTCHKNRAGELSYKGWLLKKFNAHNQINDVSE